MPGPSERVRRGQLFGRWGSVVTALAMAASACGADLNLDPTAAPSGRNDGAEVTEADYMRWIGDMQRFWAQNGASAGAVEPVDIVPEDRIQPIDGAAVRCDGDEVPKADVQDNAVALACDEGVAVMWDPAFLVDLESRLGAAASAMVLAHEWGHVVEYHTDLDLPGVLAEQYADCMAGAWVADANRRGVAPFDDAGSLDVTVAAAAEFRDETGDDPTDPDAHGLAFDRIRAFQEGYDRGPMYCASYSRTPPPLTEAPFENPAEARSDGNLSFEEAYQLSKDSLDEFMNANPEPYRVDEAEVTSLTEDELADAHARLGDAATLTIVAADTAATAQTGLGEDPSTEGSLLAQACWTGAFLGWAYGGESSVIELSPGDLDEAVAAFVDWTDPSDAGFLFEQTSQLRTGFSQGVSACQH